MTTTTTTTKTKKDWRNYSLVAFTAMKANRELWETGNHDMQRAVTKIYYDLVFSSGYNRTGLISESAYQKKVSGKKVVDDHFLSPQFVGRMMMDMGDIYLENYDEFERMFGLCRTVITVTSEENHQLRQLTTNEGGNYVVQVPTVLKYSFLNIELRKKQGNRITSAVPVTDNVETLLGVPQELTEYEGQFIPLI